jgi:hypothetical protein
MKDGPALDAPLTTNWRQVDNALRLGLRGLRGGSSLAKLLAAHRGVRNVQGLSGLSENLIETWASAYRDRHGPWPNEHSGPIKYEPGETWYNVNAALRDGLCSLPGGDTLAQPASQSANTCVSRPTAMIW